MDRLFANNRAWAEARKAADPAFFERLSKQQAPRYMWLGCADSRVPANEIIGLDPGEVFVHRNVANLAVHSDLNFLAVLQFAVDHLKVEHIMVTGHYGCGGVKAALESRQLGLVDHWLRHIRDIHDRNAELIAQCAPGPAQVDRLVEINVRTQVDNVAHSPIVQNAWARGRTLAIHGWVYDLRDGLLRDMGYTVSHPEDISPTFRFAPKRR